MPTPVAGPGEVLIRLQASGVNPADVGRRAGSYSALEFQRVIPNSDGAGLIEQVGAGVTRFERGQRVWLFNGQRNGRAFGTAAEYIALAEHLVTPLPDHLSFAEGATLGIPAMTAWCCLFGDGPIAGPDRAGDRRRRRGRPLCRATGEMGRRARDRDRQFGAEGRAGAARRAPIS